MNRRRLLAALAAGAAGTAGCLGVGDGGTESRTATSGEETAPSSRETPTPDPTTLAAQGVPATICSESVAADPGIDALVDPAFAPDWTTHEIPDDYTAATGPAGGLDPDHTVVGLRDGDRRRAYPLRVLSVHEVVNDTFGGPALVTYCPICRSGVVARRRVDGTVTPFAVTGLLWQPERIQVAAAETDNRTFGAEQTGGERVGVRVSGNLVVVGLATRSYWSQILATAICGPATSDRLSIRPSTLTTWGAWRERNPDGEVLLPPPHSERLAPTRYAGTTPAPRE